MPQNTTVKAQRQSLRPKLTGTFVQRDYDGNWQISADTSDPDFTGVDSWFNEVYEEAKETNGEG